MISDSTPTSRCGTFVLAGTPNVGKSTLLNRLVGENLAIISSKPQSTRQPVIGVRTEKDTQLLFVDAPGLLEPQYPLQHAMLQQALDQLHHANGILYLHSANEGEPPPLQSLIPSGTRLTAPVLTVLTKADFTSPEPRANVPAAALRQTEPLGCLRVSALTGLGIDELLAWCRAHAPRGPFHCDPDDVSSQPLRFFAAEFVREAAFEVLGEELPYAVAAEVEEFRESREPVYIRVSLYVERDSQKGMVIGSGGRTIKALGKLARNKIEALLGNRVYLDLWVKVLPKWRTSPLTLRQLGFPTPAGRKR